MFDIINEPGKERANMQCQAYYSLPSLMKEAGKVNLCETEMQKLNVALFVQFLWFYTQGEGWDDITPSSPSHDS